MIGASTAMSVASILITGVYGASIGQQVLTGVGIDPTEAIARGTAIGAASHSIGANVRCVV
jgi:putative effector of murein hydrolase